jgi:hypothetical protein
MAFLTQNSTIEVTVIIPRAFDTIVLATAWADVELHVIKVKRRNPDRIAITPTGKIYLKASSHGSSSFSHYQLWIGYVC